MRDLLLLSLLLGLALVLPRFAPAQEIGVDLPGGARMGFVWVGPGVFAMGSAETEIGRNADEGPQHRVAITRGFYLGTCEITQAQWEAVMATRPWTGQPWVQERPDNPAVYISWEDVQEFVRRLNQAQGDSLYRLPTEAEWEYACRAGTSTPWSCGERAERLWDHAWFSDNAWDVVEQYAHAVGTKAPNPWGLYDMHGNVWEWCQDWYGPYAGAAQVDPAGPALGQDRVTRGGSFFDFAQDARSARRYSRPPDARRNLVGARLARTGPQSTAITPDTWGRVKRQGP